MRVAIYSSETSVLTRATQHHTPKKTTLFMSQSVWKLYYFIRIKLGSGGLNLSKNYVKKQKACHLFVADLEVHVKEII
jgi:hypothetical protein